MTAAEVQSPPPGATQATRPGPAPGWVRLAWLYAASRRIPAALGLTAGLSVLLWAALHWHWNISGGPAAQQFIPLVIEIGTAAVIAVTTYGPFGEPEQATGRWLPYLRLAAAVLLTVAAVGLLCAGATGGSLPGGTLALLRNVAGATGIGLLAAAVVGGSLAWTGPMAYLLLAETALSESWTTPWAWPARPPHDTGAVICAALAFGSGVAITTVLGARRRLTE
ncbi:MAG TPA: hypothetical protein VG253_08320 [Streptosporangiaceae bacterium]|nr:hypothetical protein [Streptosporangiaceae bacterium]